MIEPYIFRLVEEDDVKAVLTVCVDDLLVVYDKEGCDKIKVNLPLNYPARNLGDLGFYGRCAYESNWENEAIKISESSFEKIIIDKI